MEVTISFEDFLKSKGATYKTVVIEGKEAQEWDCDLAEMQSKYQQIMFDKPEKKIIDWKVIQSPSLEDSESGIGGFKFEGINTQGAKLVAEGYVPYGEIQSHDRHYHGTMDFKTTSHFFTMQFVKYE